MDNNPLSEERMDLIQYKYRILLIFLIGILIQNGYAQNKETNQKSWALLLGLRTEAMVYFDNRQSATDYYATPPILSAYLKAEIQFCGYGLDFKGGYQMGNLFFGGEYGIEVKYNLTERVWPLIAGLRHINGTTSSNTSGFYTAPIYFIGAGAEAEVTKLFRLDLIFYFPVGNNKLGFRRDLSDPDKLTATSRIGPVIKLGFIFNIIRI